MNLHRGGYWLMAGIWLLAFQLRLPAQTNSAPATWLETFEQQTNVVLVKGFSSIGSLTVDQATIAVRACEVDNVNSGQKAYGLILDVALPGADSHLHLALDADELDGLAGGMDYVSKVSWGVTPLNGFEASYLTRSGLRIAAHSERRQDTIATFVEFPAVPAIRVNADQLAQLRSLILQGKSSLDSLK